VFAFVGWFVCERVVHFCSVFLYRLVASWATEQFYEDGAPRKRIGGGSLRGAPTTTTTALHIVTDTSATATKAKNATTTTSSSSTSGLRGGFSTGYHTFPSPHSLPTWHRLLARARLMFVCLFV
jgi:hypothetical protein